MLNVMNNLLLGNVKNAQQFPKGNTNAVSQVSDSKNSFSKDMKNAFQKLSQDAQKAPSQTVNRITNGGEQKIEATEEVISKNTVMEEVVTEIPLLGQIMLQIIGNNQEDTAENQDTTIINANIQENAMTAINSELKPLIENNAANAMQATEETGKAVYGEEQEVFIKPNGEAKQNEAKQNVQSEFAKAIINDIANLQKESLLTNANAEQATENIPIVAAATRIIKTFSEADEALTQNNTADIALEQNKEPVLKVREVRQEAGGQETPFNLLTDNTPKFVTLEVDANVPNVPAANTQDSFAAKLIDQLTTTIGENKSELYIQLKPEVLGGLAVKLVLSEDGLAAKLITQNRQIQNTVNLQITQLQEALRERNINVVSFDVIYEQPSQLNDGQFTNHHQQQGSGNFSSSSGQDELIEDLNTLNSIYSGEQEVSADDVDILEFSA